jgi:hypothetical protein
MDPSIVAALGVKMTSSLPGKKKALIRKKKAGRAAAPSEQENGLE